MNKSDKLYKTIDEQLDILEKRKIMGLVGHWQQIAEKATESHSLQ